MQGLTKATCLWPGLAQLWLRGEWTALAGAVVFGVALNAALLVTFVWPGTTAAAWSPLAWLAIAAVWLVCGVRTWRLLPSLLQPVHAVHEGLFIRAQDEYLKGRWDEAEALLRRLLARYRGDVEAHLMLATLFRHTRRTDEANERLRMIERFDGADTWRSEIEHERRMLRRLADTKRGEAPTTAS